MMMMMTMRIINGSVNNLYWKCQLLWRHWLDTCVTTVCMASEQKKGLFFLFEITIGCGKMCKSKHIHVWIWTLSQLYICVATGSRLFPRVTIFIVDFLFFYVAIYSTPLSEWWHCYIWHLNNKSAFNTQQRLPSVSEIHRTVILWAIMWIYALSFVCISHWRWTWTAYL